LSGLVLNGSILSENRREAEDQQNGVGKAHIVHSVAKAHSQREYL
jgi:hypothetical protein